MTDAVRDPLRLAALRRTALLDTPPEEVFDRLTRLAARVVGAPVSTLTLVDRDREFYKSAVGLADPESREGPLDTSFCRRVVEADAPLAVEDARSHPWFRDRAEPFCELAYLGYPLRTPGGHVLGTLCVSDTSPRAWTEGDHEVLEGLAAAAAAEIALRAELADRRHAESVLRESEARFRTFMTHSPAIAFLKDEEGRYVYLNRAYEEHFGTTLEERRGRTDLEFFPPDLARALRAADREVLASGPREAVETVPGADGAERDWLVLKFPVEDTDGRRLLGGMGVDVTEQRRAERIKTDLVSVVSHELRTPLTAIRAAIGLLAGGLLDSHPERAREMLATALRNTERLMKLANDLLDMERLTSGQAAMEPLPYAAAELMTQAAEVVREAAAASGIWVIVHPASATVHADPDRVNQVLVNLLANAVKFSDPRGTVWLGMEVVDGEARFCVRDHGRGIPPDKLSTIFEPFSQVDASDARRQKGMGLGLAIARGIVQRHGGRIWAESEPGKGSSFFFTLPLAG